MVTASIIATVPVASINGNGIVWFTKSIRECGGFMRLSATWSKIPINCINNSTNAQIFFLILELLDILMNSSPVCGFLTYE
jgi:hypothetical protein